MTEKRNVRIGFRLSEQDAKAIKRLVKVGRFINKSNFIRHAIRTELNKQLVVAKK